MFTRAGSKASARRRCRPQWHGVKAHVPALVESRRTTPQQSGLATECSSVTERTVDKDLLMRTTSV